MSFPKISIITPSYNQGKFIERTIKSVLNQNYPNLEYIVMDGGSTDETLSILKKYQDRLTWVSKKDNGQAHAINKGLKIATGEILAYLNSDDTYQPETFATVAKYFKSHPKANFIYGEGRLIDKNDNEIGFYQSKICNHQILAKHCPISQPTTFWTTKVYQQIGEFNEKYQFTMDYEYWIRVSKKFKLNYLKNKVLANARIHQNAKTSAFNTQLHLDAIKAVKAHYGTINSDWINNYNHSRFFSKEKNLFYYSGLILGSIFLNLVWNKKFPDKNDRSQYITWIKEFLNSKKNNY